MRFNMKNMKKWLYISFFFVCTLTGHQTTEDKILNVINSVNPVHGNIKIEKICGGLTNDNYKVSLDGKAYFFRVANLEINLERKVLNNSLEREWQITNLISKAGIGPEVIFYSPENGILVTDFIESDKTPLSLKNPETLEQFCDVIISLHQLDVQFPSEYNPILQLKEDVKKAMDLGCKIPTLLQKIILFKLDSFQSNITKTCSHLDLHSGNVLQQGDKLYLIDWEYAAMSDPFFDLATLASAETFSDVEMQELLTYYLKGNPTEEQIHYFQNMRIMADARWALWCYIQAKISPLNEPFEQMGDEFLSHCLQRLATRSLL